jgi:hypothetical protein
MKTASLSHCNLLTVISKNKKADGVGYQWDMSHVKNKGWALLQLNHSEIGEILRKNKVELGTSGTLVLWENLFWLEEAFKSYGSEKLGQNYYFRLVEQIKLHLRMVYHRFLDASSGKTSYVNLSVNGEKLKPWDPFCRNELNTENVNLKKDLSELYISGYSRPILIGAYILPNKEGFSSEENWKEARGPLSWNDSQGYYIYRANRIIRIGGWHGTKAKDEHDKLARISIDIDPSLDQLFRITVNKTKVQFPELLFQHLKNVVNPLVVKKAKAKYNKSDENLTIKNNFRKNGIKVLQVSQQLIAENKITTVAARNNLKDLIEVHNPSGTWLSNKIYEFLKYGSEKDYEIISDHLEGKQLWKIICNQNDKFKVIINASHPFYIHVYKPSKNKAVTDALDALIFSLAFAELYNKNNQNAHLFDTFKAVCSQALERLTKEEIF